MSAPNVRLHWPKQQPVKKSSKFDLPGPPTDSHGNVIGDNDIPIAVIDDFNKISPLLHTNNKRNKNKSTVLNT
jgi:hypothetical protein